MTPNSTVKQSLTVPLEPTEEMLDVAVSFALNVSLSGEYNWSTYMRDVWQRMVKASPPSPDAELVSLLRDARCDLAAYIHKAYPQYMLDYPHNQRKHAADMEIVHRIDAKLASLKP